MGRNVSVSPGLCSPVGRRPSWGRWQSCVYGRKPGGVAARRLCGRDGRSCEGRGSRAQRPASSASSFVRKTSLTGAREALPGLGRSSHIYGTWRLKGFYSKEETGCPLHLRTCRAEETPGGCSDTPLTSPREAMAPCWPRDCNSPEPMAGMGRMASDIRTGRPSLWATQSRRGPPALRPRAHWAWLSSPPRSP